MRVNIEGLHNVMELAKQYHIKLFVPSTIGEVCVRACVYVCAQQKQLVLACVERSMAGVLLVAKYWRITCVVVLCCCHLVVLSRSVLVAWH